MPGTRNIQERAETERRKQELRNAQQDNQPEAVPYAPLHPGSPKIFHRINPRAPHMGAWVVFVVIVAVVCWMLWLLNRKQFGWLLPVAICVTLLPFAVYGVQFIRAQLDYKTYTHWLNNLDFPVNGWSRLGEEENFPAQLYWDDLSVTIELKPSTPAGTIKLVEDALYLFAISAGKAFYKADHVQSGSSTDRRKRFAANGLAASGSANGEVMGYLYYFLQRDLRRIHKETNAIEAVHLVCNENIFHVKPVQIRGAGNT